MAADRYRAIVVPHTHWDREWYEPFEVFRARLVDVVDRVLELLQNEPRYPRFMLDGQAVVLEDYLAIRPERAEAIRSLVEAGKLVIGPWYVLADEFLVSPEALIRNLARGRRVCGSLGGVMKDAYTPDSFGHISQLPLLAAGFGLEAVVFERGVGDEGERLGGEFCWVAADGVTRMFAVHLLGTYSSAAGLGHADWQLRDAFDLSRAVNQLRAAIFGVDGVDLSELAEWLRTSFASVPGGMAAYATSDTLLLLNGSDHLFPQADLQTILDEAAVHLPEVDLQIGRLADYLDGARKPLEALERFQGEFRSSRYHHCLYGVLSSRMPLKQANHHAQVLLEQYVEPVTALAWAKGSSHPTALLDEAWRRLLLNHPHDSICGCSVDAVHDEMATRFANVGQLGRDLMRRGLETLSGTEGAPATLVFNPSPWRRREAVAVEVEVADGAGAQLRVHDGDGQAVASQVEVARRLAPGSSTRWVDQVRVDFLADVGGLATSAYRFVTGPEPATEETTTTDHTGAVAADAHKLQNEHLVVTFGGAGPADAGSKSAGSKSVGSTRAGSTRAGSTSVGSTSVGHGGGESEIERLEVGGTKGDGTNAGGLELLDRRSGRRRSLALRFEDVADRGDSYDFSALPGDRAIVLDRPSMPPVVTAAGPLRATWKLRYVLELPSRLSEDRRQRVEPVEMPIDVELTLAAGRPWLEVTIELDNVAEDHRLRFVVAADHQADEVSADGHFDVLRRALRPPTGDGWRQPPVPSSHQRRFVLAAADEAGLAVFNRGLPEYEARRGDHGVELHVTLLRCFGWLSRDDIPERRLESAGPLLPTPGGQCPGPQRFELAVFPFEGDWWASGLEQAAGAFTAPLYPQAVPHALGTGGPGGSESPGAGAPLSLLGADGGATPLSLSCLKRSEAGDGLVIRVWNPAPAAAAGTLRFGVPPREVLETDLSEERLAQSATLRVTDDGHLPLTLGPKQVRTFVAMFEREEGR